LLRAIIFDFDGVIVDSEPLIMRLTQRMAAQQGWMLTEKEYYRDYLALDDRGIIERLYRAHGLECDSRRRDDLVKWKARTYMELIRDGLPAMPGAVEFVRRAAELYPLAIASGSLRTEIEYLLAKIGLRDAFQTIASAEDTERSKPDPQIYNAALSRLRQVPGLDAPQLAAGECLAIEDAPAGVVAAHAAGIKCLALAHSRSPLELHHADALFQSFAEIDLNSLGEIARPAKND
jgi:beta-phosphoglucomutase